MKFEYNGNLEENERIELVANEIIETYPHLNINEAKEAAMLEGKISTNKNVDMEFNRLYNIMLVANKDKNAIKPVYEDLVDLLNNNKTEDKIDYYYNIALEIGKFLLNQRDFPYLNDM